MIKTHLATGAAVLSVAGFLGWLALSDPWHASAPPSPAAAEAAEAAVPAEPPPPPGGGSAVPCAVPLAWRLSGIDPRFELSDQAVAAAVRRAADAWERAVGRPLFAEDTLGLPIRLVYDERQEGSTERKRLERALAQADENLQAETRTLESRRAAYEQRRAQYDRDVTDFQRASALHVDSVRSFNLGGVGSQTELRAAQQRLDRRQGDLLAVGADLEEQRIAIRDDAADLSRRIVQHHAKVEELARVLAPRRVESGMYREMLQRLGGRTVAVRRAIDVYEFDDADELWLVLAHELGHALGLGHAPTPGAVMSEAHLRTKRIVSAVQPADLALLKERCPRL